MAAGGCSEVDVVGSDRPSGADVPGGADSAGGADRSGGTTNDDWSS